MKRLLAVVTLAIATAVQAQDIAPAFDMTLMSG